MNSTFVNISAQLGPLWLISLHLSIIRLSYWHSKYDNMHSRLSQQQPLALLKGSQHQICFITKLSHGYFCAVFTAGWRNGCHSKPPPREPAFLGARTSISEALCNKWATGSLVGCLIDKVWLVALNCSNGTNNNYSHFKNNNTHLSPIRQHRSQTNSLTTVDSNFTKHMVKYQSARRSSQINMPAKSAGGVWQTSMLIQRSWHQHPQHRICNLICFRTITSYFYEQLPPWNERNINNDL